MQSGILLSIEQISRRLEREHGAFSSYGTKIEPPLCSLKQALHHYFSQKIEFYKTSNSVFTFCVDELTL